MVNSEIGMKKKKKSMIFCQVQYLLHLVDRYQHHTPTIVYSYENPLVSLLSVKVYHLPV